MLKKNQVYKRVAVKIEDFPIGVITKKFNTKQKSVVLFKII